MKTLDEIKKRLADNIPVHYHPGDLEPRLTPLMMVDLEDLHADALALIQQLEAELADTKKAVGYTNGLCDICKHKNEHENECEANDFLCYNCPADCACKECYSDASHYEWRGVQKEDSDD